MPSSKNEPAGFQRISLIRQSLGAIHAFIKAPDLRSDWSTFEAPMRKQPDKTDEIVYIQQVTKTVAAHYRLANTTFIVGINPALKTLACVEVRSANEIFIEYNYKGRLNQAELWAVMAHEVAHIFLNRLGLSFADRLQNEILTDTTAIYLGFGRYYLSAQRTEFRSHPLETKKTTIIKTLGYISSAEMGYILSQRDHVMKECSYKRIESDIGRAGYRSGNKFFKKELRERPYIRRNILDQFLQRIRPVSGNKRGRITFPCIVCKRLIRIPELNKSLSVKCPHCFEKLRCFS